MKSLHVSTDRADGPTPFGRSPQQFAGRGLVTQLPFGHRQEDPVDSVTFLSKSKRSPQCRDRLRPIAGSVLRDPSVFQNMPLFGSSETASCAVTTAASASRWPSSAHVLRTRPTHCRQRQIGLAPNHIARKRHDLGRFSLTAQCGAEINQCRLHVRMAFRQTATENLQRLAVTRFGFKQLSLSLQCSAKISPAESRLRMRRTLMRS